MKLTYPKYLTQLGIRSLATGSAYTDTDAFSAWCAAVAAVAHPESKLVRNDNQQGIRVGINTLVSGSSIAGVEDHVIVPLRELQNQHLRNTEAREASAYDLTRDGRQPGYKTESLKSDVTGRVQPLDLTEEGYAAVNAIWMDKVDPSQIQAEFAVRPAFFVEGSNPSQLSEHLKSCHLGKALVALRVLDTKCAATCDMVFRTITDGASLSGSLPHQVHGRIMATVPAALLNQLAPSAVGDGGVIGGALWLTGLACGDTHWPQPPGEQKYAWGELFTRLFKDVLQNRFRGVPLVLPVTAETGEKIAEFAEHLQKLEVRMPGISNTLRSLLPTLIFGMSVLRGCHRKKGEMLSGEAIAVLAALSSELADRMMEHYLSLIDAHRRERIRRFSGAIYQRLQEGPRTVRDLTRRVNKLRVEDAKEALQFLVARGLVVQIDALWRLSDQSAILPAPESEWS